MTEPMSDPLLPPPVDPPPGPRTVKIATPWYMRLSFAVTVLLVGLSMFIFSLGVIVQQQHLQSRLDVANFRADSENNRANRNDALTRLEQECRSERSSALLIITSNIAGETAKLFNLLAARGAPETYTPVLESLTSLANQRSGAELGLKNAVAECRQPR